MFSETWTPRFRVSLRETKKCFSMPSEKPWRRCRLRWRRYRIDSPTTSWRKRPTRLLFSWRQSATGSDRRQSDWMISIRTQSQKSINRRNYCRSTDLSSHIIKGVWSLRSSTERKRGQIVWIYSRSRLRTSLLTQTNHRHFSFIRERLIWWWGKLVKKEGPLRKSNTEKENLPVQSQRNTKLRSLSFRNQL